MSNHLVWGLCVLLALPCGGIAGVLFSRHYLHQPEAIIVHQRPNITVQPASILESASCAEVARACYARKRTGKVAP